jgi:hypothetical protein
MKEKQIDDILGEVKRVLLENPYSEVSIVRNDKKIVANISKKDMIKGTVEN